MSAPFGVRVDEQGATTSIALTGELDLTTVPDVEATTLAATVRGTLVLDLRELDFIDSSGVRLLMKLDLRSRNEGWSLRLVRHPDGPVQRVLALCGFEERVEAVEQPRR